MGDFISSGFFAPTPKVDRGTYGKKIKKQKRVMPFEEKVTRLLGEFEGFCLYNNVKSETIMQVSYGEDNSFYRLGPVPTQLSEEIRVTFDCEGVKTFKAISYINRKRLGEKEIKNSASFWVYRDADRVWRAEPLLGDNESLNGQLVDQAFRKLAFFKNYQICGRASWQELTLDLWPEPQEPFRAWGRIVQVIAGDQQRYLICLVDNGKLLDVSADKVEILGSEVKFGGILRTYHSWFRYQNNRLERIK